MALLFSQYYDSLFVAELELKQDLDLDYLVVDMKYHFQQELVEELLELNNWDYRLRHI